MRIPLQIKDGQLNKQTAYDHGIRESAAKTHIGNLPITLNLRTRTQTAVLAQGLVGPQPGPTPETPAENGRARCGARLRVDTLRLAHPTDATHPGTAPRPDRDVGAERSEHGSTALRSAAVFA